MGEYEGVGVGLDSGRTGYEGRVFCRGAGRAYGFGLWTLHPNSGRRGSGKCSLLTVLEEGVVELRRMETVEKCGGRGYGVSGRRTRGRPRSIGGGTERRGREVRKEV